MRSNLQHGVDEAGLISVVKYYCEEISIKARVDADVMARLITASRHRFGRSIDTIINAIECALWDGDKTLTNDHFAEAWLCFQPCSHNLMKRLFTGAPAWPLFVPTWPARILWKWWKLHWQMSWA